MAHSTIRNKRNVNPRPFKLHELIAKAFPKKFSVQTIYHYTTLDVAQLFLNPEKIMLYCTYAKALNDNQEYMIGIEYAEAHIAEVMHLDAEVLSEVKAMLNQLKNIGYRIPWVMSFSTQRDLLSQWRAYTDKKNGGYAIGFSFSELEKLVKKIVLQKAANSKGRPPYILHLLPCFYLDYESETSMQEVSRFFKLIFDDHFNNVVTSLIDVNNLQQYAAAIVSLICVFAAFIKHQAFKEEDEYRLMIQVCDKDYEKNVEIVGNKPRMKISEKIRSVDLHKMIKELWTSPHGDTDILKSIAHFMQRRYNGKWLLYYSNLPFNGR